MMNNIFIYNLTLFKLVHRLLTKRLFLSCVQYTSSRGRGVSTLAFFLEIYILISEL